MNRRAMVALTLLGAALAVAPAARAAGTFDDDDGLPAEPFVEAIAAAGITAGCSGDLYCPAAPVTRADMAVFLARGFGVPEAASPFPDVASGYAAGAVGGLAARGAVSGCSDTHYCPGATVTRGQMAVMLARLMRLSPGPSPFADTGGHFAERWVGAIAARGVTAGCAEGFFCPDAVVTRGDMAVFLARALGLAPAAVPPAPAPGPGPAPSGLDALERQVEALVDAARDAAGLGDVLVAPVLTDYSRGWSEHMAATGAFAHSDLSFVEGLDWCWAGENIQWSSGYASNEVAANAHEALMSSPAHRANILNPSATHIGIGFAESGDGKVYLTEVFLCSNAPVEGERPPG